jgi:hypothetical protein
MSWTAAKRNLPRWLTVFAVVATAVSVYPPFAPWFPAPGLDESWIFALNQALAQGLVFGKDVVFTFGPYGSVYTEMYHPAVYRLSLLAGLYLAACHAALMLVLMRGTRLRWPLAACVLLAVFPTVRDPLLLTYPLLLALLVYRVTLPDSEGRNLDLGRGAIAWFVFLSMPLGMLPLVKGSLMPLCAVTVLLCWLMLLRSGRKWLAWALFLTPLPACVLFWQMAGQPVTALPDYVMTILQIIAGYTEAMASPGNTAVVVGYLVMAVCVLFVAGTVRGISVRSRAFLVLSLGVFLFLAFKAGFVRYDIGHAKTAVLCMIWAALLLHFCLYHRYLNILLLACVLGGTAFDYAYVGTTAGGAANAWLSTYYGAGKGIANLVLQRDTLTAEFDASLRRIADEFRVPPLQGTADLYSYEQTYLLASQNRWAPRPVLQSYSAYTPALADLDRGHLEDAGAPDNIIFKVEPIDRRFPSLEDGASWPVLLSLYAPAAIDHGFVFLKRLNPAVAPSAMVPISDGMRTLGEAIVLPPHATPLYAVIEVRPTLAGRVLALLYKPLPLEIEVETVNGVRRSFSAISGMIAAGFVLSPLVTDTQDFTLLFGPASYSRDRLLRSVRVSAAGGTSPFWVSSYNLKLSRFEPHQTAAAVSMIDFDRAVDPVPGRQDNEQTLQCDAAIDSLNGRPMESGVLSVSGVLTADGWAAVSAKEGVVPDSVFVTLTNERGVKTYLHTRRTKRPDLQLHFQHSSMLDSGYHLYADVAGLAGRYQAGLAFAYRGKVISCAQFNAPVVISQ